MMECWVRSEKSVTKGAQESGVSTPNGTRRISVGGSGSGQGPGTTFKSIFDHEDVSEDLTGESDAVRVCACVIVCVCVCVMFACMACMF
jgi:hypothetical protein